VRRITLDPRHPDAAALAPAVEEIRLGGVVALPTDTLYALAADPRSAAAVGRVLTIKGRSAVQTIALIAADVAQVEALVDLTPAGTTLAARFWPGPLTLVCPARATLAPAVVGPGGGVGIRVPAHGVAREFAAACGHAVTATSANLGGRPPTADPDIVASSLPEVGVLIDAGLSPGGAPSTIVDLTGPAPVLIRAGAVPWDRVLESLRDDAI
jgi:L-threonylcarbamoyladenylate synthase